MNKDEKIINSLKSLSIDMIDHAKSGHPGIVLGAAPIIYSLYKNHLKINPKDDKWINRDRFILSAGHGSSLLYAMLFYSGYDIKLDDLKSFRQIDSLTPGHPEYNFTPGVDMTTGPLGQGVASAVGIAIAERYLANTYNLDKKNNELKKEFNIFDYYTYVLCSDGDLMEGVANEALSLAGTLSLNKLIILYDANDITLDGELNKSFTENVKKKYEAIGFNVIEVDNGNDVDTISKAIIRAKKETNKPSLIKINTIIGQGSLLEGTNQVHGAPLTDQDLVQLKKKLKAKVEPFVVDNKLKESFSNEIISKGEEQHLKWNQLVEEYLEIIPVDLKKNFVEYIRKEVNVDFNYENFIDEATRDSNGKVINLIANNSKNFIGGSADLSSSTKTNILNENIFPKGRNIWFGVREHAMGAILNGIGLCNLSCYGSTFFSFADYLKPAIRVSCLMGLPVTYIFTHDSIYVGEDGPTHQPVEQLAMLRTIPNLTIFRPCDTKETLGAWEYILKNRKPAALILTRQKTKLLANSSIKQVSLGGYIIKEERNKLELIMIATGSEVENAVEVGEYFEDFGKGVRVISMPNVNLFLKQSAIYQDQILPKGYKTFVIEASNDNIWFRFIDSEEFFIGVDTFGYSGNSENIELKFGLDLESIKKNIARFL